MYTVREATAQDAEAVNDVIHKSFQLYADELKPFSHVKALEEAADIVLSDIERNRVFVAEDESGAVLGSIRYCALTADLAYIYRFGVDPQINNTGIGSDLLKTVIEECRAVGFQAIALHTNSRYYKLARYYYGKQFYVHSTATDKGYIRALFIKELTGAPFDISPALEK